MIPCVQPDKLCATSRHTKPRFRWSKAIGISWLCPKCGYWFGFRNLLITDDQLRCRFAHFKLIAHLLDLRRLRFHSGCECFNLLLLLRNPRFLLLHSAM